MTCIYSFLKCINALPNSLTNSTSNPKVKTIQEEDGVGVRSLARSTSGVRGMCWSSGMGTKMSDKQVNYSHGHAQTKQQVLVSA
jgi:hypothetical protein